MLVGHISRSHCTCPPLLYWQSLTTCRTAHASNLVLRRRLRASLLHTPFARCSGSKTAAHRPSLAFLPDWRINQDFNTILLDPISVSSTQRIQAPIISGDDDWHPPQEHFISEHLRAALAQQRAINVSLQHFLILGDEFWRLHFI